ncbi:DUF993 family protein [Microbacterium sp. YY-01]|uniref:DUF993 family protein n=1 Tax=Microbacterium sp. YY-01 TaxID=3421634 RepID=UPI003D16C4A1
MTSHLALVAPSGERGTCELHETSQFVRPTTPLQSRVVYAAAHVIPRTTGENTPGSPADIDWDATLDFRRNLYSWGLGVADAMDTAQRNLGLDALATRELIARSATVAHESDGNVVVGVNTDHLDEEVVSLDTAIDAYKSQLHFTEEQGAGVVIMASRHIARAATSAADYARAYREVLEAADGPVILHWLGEAFDPALAGYFGSRQWKDAAANVIEIIEDNVSKVAGIKMSLLDAASEVYVRERLPESVRMFTGDDFNYVGLIGGADVPAATQPSLGVTERRHSDALLGAFAAIGPAASAAVQALDRRDPDEYLAILGPTEPLSRQIFAAPTYFYKTGVAFMSWLNGHQDAFQMVGGQHASRSLPHLSRIIELANEARVLERPDLAAQRWHAMLRINGLDT